MSVSVNIDKVVKKFGEDKVIDKLSLDIQKGELFTLLGPSGCGKTTLLRMIIGFHSIDDGQIKIDDKVINHIPVNKRKMGMVFQNYAIFPHMTVEDNIAFGLKVNKIGKEEMTERINDILKTVRIEEHKTKKPENLSGGQQQRIALARALVIHPKVLLMDEPLSNLDAKLRIEMRNAIKNIQQEVGITTVYVTHDQEEALAISDRIAVMNKGIIQQIGKPEEIYSRPANVFVSQFIGTSNIIKGIIKKKEDGLYVHLNDMYSVKMNNLKQDEIVDKQEVLVSVRPQEFIITNKESGIKGEIDSTMFLGLNTHYFVNLDSGERVEVIQDSEEEEILPEGKDINLNIKSKKINIYHADTKETLIKAGGHDEQK
ncbi:ABC transporter ATP-binding protein [Oceanobacillus sojae]|uniref:Spermidine/putrescine import ATP-binding protein PotA n=1 Tax=Oceanobacillus sojae TaxID=582851 RepID=A0A511ZFP6_9BACI|nr:ABC transporter ATP-binding protein [Oceanobacillus sojae]GEN86265.1 Fe(3+) ions import ATP-binding protein FbpC [Oceanobacillus sojae]